jgi:glycosyl transferase, family 25
MSLLDYFDRTYVINLPDRLDRRQGVERELASVGMPLRPGKVEIFPATRPDSPGPFQSVGIRGAFLSHLALLKRARQEQLANVLVMEDDVQLSPRLREAAPDIVAQLRAQPWDLVYLGHFEPTQDHGKVLLQRRPEGLKGLHCVGVNGRIIPRLVDFLEGVLQRAPGSPEGGPMHVDGAFSFLREKNPEIIALISHPSLAGQRSSRSDVTPKWFESVPGLRQAAALARSLRALGRGER